MRFFRVKENGKILYGGDKYSYSERVILEFDANISEVNLKVIFNYTVTMEYTVGPPIVLLTPFIAFGLKINNFTDFTWEYFKCKHEGGLLDKKGNVSVNITLDTNNVTKGDSIVIYPTSSCITDPMLVDSNLYPNFPKKTSPLLRVSYFFPKLHDILIKPIIIPFYSKFNSVECCPIYVNFV